MAKFKKMDNTIVLDNILSKISEEGITSLSRNEIKYLNQCSKNDVNIQLENSLEVDKGHIFISDNKDINILKFEYHRTQYIGDVYYNNMKIVDTHGINKILHYGKLYIDDKIYNGFIECEDDGEYKKSMFHIIYDHEISDGFDYDEDGEIIGYNLNKAELNAEYNDKYGNLYEDYKDNIKELEHFFRFDICPYLIYS